MQAWRLRAVYGSGTATSFQGREEGGPLLPGPGVLRAWWRYIQLRREGHPVVLVEVLRGAEVLYSWGKL